MKLVWKGNRRQVYWVEACPFARLSEQPQPWERVSPVIKGDVGEMQWGPLKPETAYRVATSMPPPDRPDPRSV